jgi:ribosomal protein S13
MATGDALIALKKLPVGWHRTVEIAERAGINRKSAYRQLTKEHKYWNEIERRIVAEGTCRRVVQWRIKRIGL